MQYAFAYFYYLMHVPVVFNLSEVWNTTFDLNGDGQLNNNELRTMALHLYGTPLTPPLLSGLTTTLVNCCRALQQQEGHIQTTVVSGNDGEDENGESKDKEKKEPYWGFPSCPITLKVLESCNKTRTEIEKIFSKKLRFKHQIDGTDEVAFLMVGNNHTTMQTKLDGVRTRRQKFICLNDNIDHSLADSHKVVEVLHEFYEAILPNPSRFELPKGVRNTYLYIEELREARKVEAVRKRYALTVGIISILAIGCMVWQCWSYAKKADRRSIERRARRFLNT